MVTFWRTQQPALDNRNDDEIVCQCFIAGTRQYCSFANSYSYSKYILNKNDTCNEVLTGHCHSYFDLDAKGITLEELGWGSEKEFVLAFTEFLIQGFEKHTGVQLVPKNFLWASSCRPEKISFHLVIKHPDFFWHADSKCADFRQLTKILAQETLERQGFYFLSEDTKDTGLGIRMTSLLDTGIITKNRCFRSLYCRKLDSDSKLIPLREGEPVKISETLIRKYCITLPESETQDRTQFPLLTKFCIKKNPGIPRGLLDQLAAQFQSEVVKVSGSLIILKNSGETRTCPINNEVNSSDHAFFIKKSGCIWLGCHNEGCRGKLHKCFQFQSRFKYYEDYRLIIKTPKTERAKSLIQEYILATCSMIDKPEESFFVTNSKAPLQVWKNIEGKHCILTKNLFQKHSDICLETQDGKVRFSSVLKELVQERKLRTYNSISWCPYIRANPVLFPRNKLNSFSGFVLDDPNIITNVDFTKTMIYDLLKRLCNFKEDCTEYLFNFLALRLQKVGQIKPGIALCFLNSKPGSGKGSFGEFLKALFACSRTTVVSYNKLKQFQSPFNSELQHAIWLILEEISSKVREVDGLLKDMCTTTSILLEPKNENRRVCDFFGTMCLFSNKIRCVNIPRNDRRMCVLESNPDKANNKEYFDLVYKELRDLKTMRSAFIWFCSRDITDFDFRKFPKTKLREHVQNCSDSFEHKFYKHIFRNVFVGQYSYTITPETLYEEWKEFCFNYGSTMKRDRGFVTSNFECAFQPQVIDEHYEMTQKHIDEKLGGILGKEKAE